MTRKENANARLRQTASASRARGANKERRGENDRVTARNARAGARDSDGRNGQMRTEEQPEIVEEGLKEEGGERGDRSIESSEYRDGQAEETRGIVSKYMKNGGIKTKTASM